ncbi:MAG: hypothetical protein AB7E47_02275 [Desulfovibrionaceae bacterium]
MNKFLLEAGALDPDRVTLADGDLAKALDTAPGGAIMALATLALGLEAQVAALGARVYNLETKVAELEAAAADMPPSNRKQ